MSTKVFGVPLEQVVESDRKKHPDLRIPFIAHNSLTAIMREGFDSEGIFRVSGNKERVAGLKEAIDRGDEVDLLKDKVNANDVSSLFKMYLRELPDPLLTSERYDNWLDVNELRDVEKQRTAVRELLESLPPANRHLLAALMHVLSRIAMNSASNKMDSANLSKTVGPNLLWKDGKGDSVEFLVHSVKINQIVQMLIDDYEFYFPNDREEHSKFALLHCKLMGHKKSIAGIVKMNDEIWSVDSNGIIRIWNIATHQPIKELDTDQGRIFSINAIKNTVWTCSQKCAKIWNSETKECIKRIDIFAYCATVAHDMVWLAGDGKINILSTPDYTVVKELAIPGIPFCMALDSAGKNMWTGGTDRTLRVYDIQTLDLVKHIREGHTKKINCIVAEHDRIWTAGDDNHIFVWNSLTFDLITQIDAHAGAIFFLSLCGDMVWTCSWDTNVKVWSTKTFEKVHTLPNFHSDAVSSVITFLNTSKQCMQAWSSSWDKSICVWTLGPKLVPEGMESLTQTKIKKTSSVEGKKHSLEDRMDELTKKADELQSKHEDLKQKAKEIKEKKQELNERKEQLNKKKQELEEKRKELAKRKEELAHLQSDIESQTN